MQVKKILLFTAIFLSCQNSWAQSKATFIPLKVGDSIRAEIITNTNSVYQKGAGNLSIGIRLKQIILYKVEAASGKSYTFSMHIALLQDTLKALGQDAFYSKPAEMAVQTNSVLQGHMDQVFERLDTIQTDRYGIVLSAKTVSDTAKTGYLPQLAGLDVKTVKPGECIDFFSSFSIPQYQVDIKWKDYATVSTAKAVTDCRLSNVDDSSATVQYSKTITDQYSNTNTNGAELIERNTGLVKERITQSRVAEYILMNQVLVAVNRSIAVGAHYTFYASAEN